MNLSDTQETLIEKTIEVIAKVGLEKTTTKAITAGTGINEAYIYRYFADKEDLLVKTFIKLDEELLEQTLQHISVMYVQELEYKLRCRIYFDAIWKFLLNSKEKCLAFIRYFYSPYFTKLSAEDHKKRFLPLVEKFKDAFIEEADVWMILNHILNVLLAFAVMVHNDQMSPEDDYAEHVFRVIYASVKQYFKNTEERDFV